MSSAAAQDRSLERSSRNRPSRRRVRPRAHRRSGARPIESAAGARAFLGKYHDLSSKPVELPVFEDDRARLRLTPRHYAYLRISEGCSQGCTFCTIPSIRGRMRSKPLPDILAEAQELLADGAFELNLIGQDTTSYGQDIGYSAKGEGLPGMLRALDKLVGQKAVGGA